MTSLSTDLNLSAPDDIYTALLDLVDGRDDQTAAAAFAAVALVLANHVGDDAVVADAIALVRHAFDDGGPPEGGRIFVKQALDRFFAQHPETGMSGVAA